MSKSQNGFTLIEIVIGLAISGIIASGVVMTVGQVLQLGPRGSDHMTLLVSVQNVGHWISLDSQRAETAAPGAGNGFPLVLSRTEYDGTSHETAYTIVDGTLRRALSIDGGAASETVVARYMDSTSTSCQLVDGLLVLTVTAKTGSGRREQSETRVFKVDSRVAEW